MMMMMNVDDVDKVVESGGKYETVELRDQRREARSNNAAMSSIVTDRVDGGDDDHRDNL